MEAEYSGYSTSNKWWLMSAIVCDGVSQGRSSEYSGKRVCKKFTLEVDSCCIKVKTLVREPLCDMTVAVPAKIPWQIPMAQTRLL